MFALPVYRHRSFESSILILTPGHPRHTVVIGSGRNLNNRGKSKGTLNASSGNGNFGHTAMVTVAGNQFKKKDGELALGIDWMTKYGLSQAIPPAYTEFIGKQLIAALESDRVQLEQPDDCAPDES